MAANPQLMMKEGKFDEESPEFQQFKRQNITKWGSLTQVWKGLEKLISQYPVSFAYIDIERMIYLADLELERLTRDDLIECITNKSAVIDAMTDPRKRFKGANGAVLAVVKLQAAWRRLKASCAYQQTKFLMMKATVIQRKFRLYQLKKAT